LRGWHTHAVEVSNKQYVLVTKGWSLFTLNGKTTNLLPLLQRLP